MECRRANGSDGAFGAVFANGPPSRFVQSGGVAWRGCSGTLELAASRGGWHSFQMQGLGFRVANDRHHLDLHHVGLFLDGKLPLDYIRPYGFELDESRTIDRKSTRLNSSHS